MPRSLTRISLALLVLLAGDVWALGLGEIRLNSALNEPLRAEIELISATPEELANLEVSLASSDTFARYGIDRPFDLQDIRFEVVSSGRPDGNYIRVTSSSPVTEPFLTFLVEAIWQQGRLLREYTVLLDPPTFAPPGVSEPERVAAPQRTEPADSGRIEREVETGARTQPRPEPARAEPPTPVEAPRTGEDAGKPAPVASDVPFDEASGGDVLVERGDTLWGIASAVRPDSRLTMNQTMLAIFEANPDAFGGNINLLRAGARLSIPSAEDIYRIERGDAFAEAKRQNEEWNNRTGAAPAPSVAADTSEAETRPSLTLVPPDEEPAGLGTGDDTGEETAAAVEEPLTREQEILERIAEIEAADLPEQQSLIEIRNNELASLQRELAEIRGEPYEPGTFVDEPVGDEALTEPEDLLADDELAVDEPVAGIDDTATGIEAEDTSAAETTPTRVRRVEEPSLVDSVIGWLTNSWLWIVIGALVIAGGLLFWFMRRGGGDDDLESWTPPIDSDDAESEAFAGTESMRAPSRDDESIVVVEQSARGRIEDETVEAEAPPSVAPRTIPDEQETATFEALDDTFSSDTAVNLDQSDPIAEADFHMAYGLYDQAADLVNGALEAEPDRQDLLTKLCEIYFVWGNRDAFTDAAERLQNVTGGSSADWDKIVIMGQQIAADHPMFAGAGVAGATREVDLDFESDEASGTGALDMDFGADEETGSTDKDDGLDFVFEEEQGDEEADEGLDFSVAADTATVEQQKDEATIDQPRDEPTSRSPTIEDQFDFDEGTNAMPALEDTAESGARAPDETAEIDLDDLDLDLDGLADTGERSVAEEGTDLSALADDDETELASLDELDSTGRNEAVDEGTATGRNPEIDADETGLRQALDSDATGMHEQSGFGELDDMDDLTSTGRMQLARDETGQYPLTDTAALSGLDEDDLLDLTGKTEIIDEEDAVSGSGGENTIGDDDATLLAKFSEDEDDFDFAKTEALPEGSFTNNKDDEETGELPAFSGADMDLDLDDLTSQLEAGAPGDTVEQARDDVTVEQPRPQMDDDDDTMHTQSLSTEDFGEDLEDARTMTEVGTKLDLARAYVDMGDPAGARSILEEVLDEGDQGQRQQAQQLLDALAS